MSTLQDEALSPADQKALDALRATVDQLTPAGCRRLLALLARKSLPAEGGSIPLPGDDGDVFAYVSSANRPVYDFTGRFTKEELAAIERNLTDPNQLMTLEEFLAQVEAGDDRTPRPE